MSDSVRKLPPIAMVACRVELMCSVVSYTPSALPYRCHCPNCPAIKVNMSTARFINTPPTFLAITTYPSRGPALFIPSSQSGVSSALFACE